MAVVTTTTPAAPALLLHADRSEIMGQYSSARLAIAKAEEWMGLNSFRGLPITPQLGVPVEVDGLGGSRWVAYAVHREGKHHTVTAYQWKVDPRFCSADGCRAPSWYVEASASATFCPGHRGLARTGSILI